MTPLAVLGAGLFCGLSESLLAVDIVQKYRALDLESDVFHQDPIAFEMCQHVDIKCGSCFEKVKHASEVEY